MLIAAFYIRRSRALGIGTRVRPYVVIGILIAVVLTGAALWLAHYPIAEHDILGVRLDPQQFSVVSRLVSPTSAIGLALVVLSRAERNRPLLVVALAYLAIVLVPIDFHWVVEHASPWYFLPHLVLAAALLLLAGIGFAFAQWPSRRLAE